MANIAREQIIKAISDATGEVFSTMLGLELEPRDPYIERAAPALSEGVVSLIGLAGCWAGVGSLSCSATLACRICSQLLLSQSNAVDDEVLDAIGEVTNMIIGNVKTAMEEHLGPLGLSIPTVIYGRNFSARSQNGGEWIVVPFDCGGEAFLVKACFVPSGDAATRPGMAHPVSMLT